jgi:dihydroorotase-like cyclic amidohydrolase
MTGAEELAAGGLLAIPGGVDGHTHLMHRGLGDRVGSPVWDVDTLCSDHAPWTLEAKLDSALTVVTARQGVADLETLMPMTRPGAVRPHPGRYRLSGFFSNSAC